MEKQGSVAVLSDGICTYRHRGQVFSTSNSRTLQAIRTNKPIAYKLRLTMDPGQSAGDLSVVLECTFRNPMPNRRDGWIDDWANELVSKGHFECPLFDLLNTPYSIIRWPIQSTRSETLRRKGTVNIAFTSSIQRGRRDEKLRINLAIRWL